MPKTAYFAFLELILMAVSTKREELSFPRLSHSHTSLSP